MNKNLATPNDPLTPTIRINLDLADGRSLQKLVTYPPERWQASTSGADVRIGEHRMWRGPRTGGRSRSAVRARAVSGSASGAGRTRPTNPDRYGCQGRRTNCGTRSATLRSPPVAPSSRPPDGMSTAGRPSTSGACEPGRAVLLQPPWSRPGPARKSSMTPPNPPSLAARRASHGGTHPIIALKRAGSPDAGVNYRRDTLTAVHHLVEVPSKP
jgi:hypothetical protein